MNDILNEDCIRQIIRKMSCVTAYLFGITCHHNRILVADVWRLMKVKRRDHINHCVSMRPYNKQDIARQAASKSSPKILDYLKECGITFIDRDLRLVNATTPGVFKWLCINTAEPIKPKVLVSGYNHLIVRATNREVIVDARDCVRNVRDYVGNVNLDQRACATLYEKYPDLLPKKYGTIENWILDEITLSFIGTFGLTKCINYVLESITSLHVIYPMIVQLLRFKHYSFIDRIAALPIHSVGEELLTAALLSGSMAAVNYVEKYHKLTQLFIDDFFQAIQLKQTCLYHHIFAILMKTKYRIPTNFFDTCNLICNDHNLDLFLKAVAFGGHGLRRANITTT